MTPDRPRFELPKAIDRYLAALSKLYAHDGRRREQEVIVNAQVRVHEEWSYDNWDGGTYGHALYLAIPEALYLACVPEKNALQEEIKADINKIHNVRNEFVDEVFLEMMPSETEDWRRESGVLQARHPVVVPETSRRIWGENGYRVFVSHKVEAKKEAAQLKARLQVFGVACFVAHEDIHPTKEWQDEIESALTSMDAFVALLTPDFHDSLWTDQEVGFALGRRVPIIAIRVGRDPYGFIGRFQALSCPWEAAAKELVDLLIEQPGMLDAYVTAVGRCSSFDHGNTLSQTLPRLGTLADDQVQLLVAAYNENDQLQGSYGFSGTWPSKFGDGLAVHLSRITGRKYRVTSSGVLQVAP